MCFRAAGRLPARSLDLHIQRLPSGHRSFLKCGKHLVRGQWKSRDADADRIGDGVGNGCARGDDRRFAEADHAALVVSWPGHHVNHEFAEVTDGGQLVELHVGVEHDAERLVHHFLLKQRVADAHNHRTIYLAFSRLHVDDQTTILNGNHTIDVDLSRFRTHGNVRNLNAAHAAVAKVTGARVLAGRLNGLYSQLGASLLPRQTL